MLLPASVAATNRDALLHGGITFRMRKTLLLGCSFTVQIVTACSRVTFPSATWITTKLISTLTPTMLGERGRTKTHSSAVAVRTIAMRVCKWREHVTFVWHSLTVLLTVTLSITRHWNPLTLSSTISNARVSGISLITADLRTRAGQLTDAFLTRTTLKTIASCSALTPETRCKCVPERRYHLPSFLLRVTSEEAATQVTPSSPLKTCSPTQHQCCEEWRREPVPPEPTKQPNGFGNRQRSNGKAREPLTQTPALLSTTLITKCFSETEPQRRQLVGDRWARSMRSTVQRLAQPLRQRERRERCQLLRQDIGP